MKRRTLFASLMLAFVLAPAISVGADYPTRSIRVIVPFGAGGVTDAVARITARAMEKSLGQPVIVENKPGAEGAIAANTVKNAEPDGYTLFFATSSSLSTPLLSKAATFDPIHDFAPISTVGRFPYAMFVHKDVPGASLKDLVAYARANPGKLNYGTVNVGEQLAAAQFIKATGVDMVRIPHKVSPMSELLAGRIDIYIGPLGMGLPHVRDGKLKLLATFPAERTALTPDIPTMAEAGVIGITAGASYQMFLAPARTPREIVERLSKAVNAAVADPEVRAQFEKASLTPEGMTPPRLTQVIAESNVTWAQFFREAGVEKQ
jgi:tripartite-type tricarboxylate transporter receptor subunit TctC